MLQLCYASADQQQLDQFMLLSQPGSQRDETISSWASKCLTVYQQVKGIGGYNEHHLVNVYISGLNDQDMRDHAKQWQQNNRNSTIHQLTLELEQFSQHKLRIRMFEAQARATLGTTEHAAAAGPSSSGTPSQSAAADPAAALTDDEPAVYQEYSNSALMDRLRARHQLGKIGSIVEGLVMLRHAMKDKRAKRAICSYPKHHPMTFDGAWHSNQECHTQKLERKKKEQQQA